MDPFRPDSLLRETVGLETGWSLAVGSRARSSALNVLKNGCKVEALQLSAIDRIERALALFMIVAWRVANLMRVGRTCPNLDAALFFDPDEIRGAYLLSKKPQPTEPPRLNEVLRLIAQLGGFLARKSDGEPGVKTIWQGLQRVMDVATALQSMREGHG